MIKGLATPPFSSGTQSAPKIALAMILLASAIGLLPCVDLSCRPGDTNTITGRELCKRVSGAVTETEREIK